MASDLDEIKKRNEEYIELYAQGDGEKLWKSLYKEGAYMMAPGVDTATGEDAMKIICGLISSGVTKMSLKPDEIRINGDWAIERGHFEAFKGDEMADNGKYLVFWEKIDGKWWYSTDIFNSNKK